MNTVCIFSSDDIGEIEAIKNILEENSIPTMIKNLYTQNVFGGLKIFTGHDAIAGSIQIFVREDDLEKGLEILKGDDEIVAVESSNVEPGKHQVNEHKKSDDFEESELKRLIYVAFVLSAFSFLVVPYFINLPVLIRLSKVRKTIFRMLLVFSTAMMLFGAMVLIRLI